MHFAHFANAPPRFFAPTRNFGPSRCFGPGKYLSLTRFLVLSLFLFAAAGLAFSQSDRGAIAGTVLDSSGAAVANATVTATDSNQYCLHRHDRANRQLSPL